VIHGDKSDIGPSDGVRAKEKIRLAGDVSKFVNPGELSQSVMNAVANLIVSQDRGWGCEQFSFV